jgi:sigma-B regulation protein RsbU (phosphoserine phosphatase)
MKTRPAAIFRWTRGAGSSRSTRRSAIGLDMLPKTWWASAWATYSTSRAACFMRPILRRCCGCRVFSTRSLSTWSVIANAAERRAVDGSVISTRITLLMATDRRRYERELLNARDQSRLSEAAAKANLRDERQTSELREQFIAVLGHDLRNPLASISAGARILLRRTKDETETQVLHMMQMTVTRMSGLIDNVLDFARGRLGGGITLSRDTNRPLGPVLQQVVDELRTAMPDRVIEADFAIAEPVNCDRSRIGQMVSNLLGNALTHGASDKPVRMAASTDNRIFVLWIANAGEPIPEAAMTDLFEPFFRGRVRAGLQGLGLGLHIASEIARAHGGTLTVTSTAEETRFTFRMPLRTATAVVQDKQA